MQSLSISLQINQAQLLNNRHKTMNKQQRPIVFQSKLNSNFPSFKESPSKQFYRTNQNQMHHVTPNFYKYDNAAANRTGPINFNASNSLNKEESLMINTNPNYGNLSKNLKANTHQNFYKNAGTSLFDNYYKHMLLLDECDPSDIQVALKNPVVYEEELKIQSKIEVNPKDKKLNKTQQLMGKAAIHINEIPIQSRLKSGFSRLSPQKNFENQRSQQFVENEILFNHKKIIAQRKAQKYNFLSNIQSKIEALEKQTEEIQKIRAQQRDELQNIRNLQEGIQSQIGNKKILGKIDQLLLETLQDGQYKKKLVKKIQQQMEAEQINDIIDEEVKANNDLLEQIEEQLKGRKKVQASGAGWWNSKQKSIGGDKIKQVGSKLNTAVGGFNHNNKSLNSSAGFGSRMTVKETGVDIKKQSKNMSSTFNKSNSKKIVSTQNSNNKNRSNQKRKN